MKAVSLAALCLGVFLSHCASTKNACLESCAAPAREIGGVSFRFPEKWTYLSAGGYLLARPTDGKADERVLAISHKAASSEDMDKFFGIMSRPGPGGFSRLEASPSPCFNAAWYQRKGEEEWNKLILFRDQTKVEVRIETDGGKKRILEIADGFACTGSL